MPEPHRPFVSVKFDAVGRTHRFLLPEIDFAANTVRLGPSLGQCHSWLRGEPRRPHRQTASYGAPRRRTSRLV